MRYRFKGLVIEICSPKKLVAECHTVGIPWDAGGVVGSPDMPRPLAKLAQAASL